MRIENTRSARGPMRHRCGFFTSRADLSARLTDLIGAAVERGTTVALSATDATAALLSDAIGSTRQLTRLSAPGSASHSGQTLATRRARELRELTVTDGPVAMVSEHRDDLDGTDGSFWTEYDAALNVALADLPVEVTCFYPELALHRRIGDGARLTHHELLVGTTTVDNPDYRPPRAVLEEQHAPAPALLGAPELQMSFGAWQLNEVRAAVEATLVDAGYALARAEDMVLAINEITTNAVEYGTAGARMCLWLEPEGAVCEVHDSGRLRDPLPGLRAPHSSDPRGRGVWIARQICDALHVWADDDGTHVRMHAGLPV